MMNARRFIILVLLLLACPAYARGNELSIVPTLAVKEEYNSNVLLVPDSDPNNLKKDFITTLSPGFELHDKTEARDFVLSLRLDKLLYSGNSELSATNPQFGISVNNAATQRLKFSVEAGYQKNSNPSLNTGPGPKKLEPGIYLPAENPPQEPQPQPPPESQQQSQRATPRVPGPELPFVATPAEHITSGFSAGFQVTEKTSVSAQYRYSAGSYEKPQYRDTSHDVQAGFATDLGTHFPRTKGRLTAGYSQYLLPDSKTFSVMGTIGFSYDVNETWSIVADAGLRRTRSEIFVQEQIPLDTPPGAFQVVDTRLDNASWGRVGHLSLIYRGEYTGVELGYTRDLTLASGLQAAAEQNTVALTTSYKMTRELSAALSAAYGTYRSDPSETTRVIKQNTISVSPFLQYEFYRMSGEKRNLVLEAGYERTRIDYLALNTDADRYTYFIRLSASFPFSSSSQYK